MRGLRFARASTRAALLAACLVLAAPIAPRAQDAVPAEEIAYEASAEAVVVRFRERYGELRGASGAEGADGAESSFVVYGDGRAVVTHPPAHRQAGRRERTMDPVEIRGLLAELLELGLGDVDPVDARRERHAARTGRERLSATSDRSTIVIEFDFERRPAERAAEPVTGALRWVGLRADARAHPGLASIQRLDRVRRRLARAMDEVAREGRVR